MRIWLWLSRTRTQDRVGEGSSPRERLSPVSDKAEGPARLDAGATAASWLPTARARRPFSVNRPSPPRDQGVWPEPLVPRSISRPVSVVGIAREGSHARRRAAGCSCETGGRGSAAPAGSRACQAAARSGRSVTIHSASVSVSRPISAAARSSRQRKVCSGKSAGWTGSKKSDPSAAWTVAGR